jgi:hypothetical protein
VREWRSRGFVRPLLLTLGGLVASWLFADAISGSCGRGCAYLASVYIVYFLLALVPGLILTGFVVGMLSGEVRLALWAMSVAGLILCVAAGIITITAGDGSTLFARAIDGVGVVLILGVLAVPAIVPIGLGFGSARVIKRLVRTHLGR